MASASAAVVVAPEGFAVTSTRGDVDRGFTGDASDALGWASHGGGSRTDPRTSKESSE